MTKRNTKIINQQISAPNVFKVDVFPIPDSSTYLDGVRLKVFLDRYAWKGEDNKPIEEVPEQMWGRVAKTLASVEKTPTLRKAWEEKFYSALSDFKFLPGGRILSAAGTGYEVTYYNCFVLPSPSDSRGGILDNLKVMTEILSRAGGAGINLSTLRPKGARVQKVNGTSSGPVNWANLYSVASHDVIQQGGCFAGDTKIMTHLGLVPISQIIKGKKDWYALTHKGYQKVTAKFNNGQKTLFELKTKAGFSVKTTAEHRFVSVDSKGHFFLKRLGDFQVGDNVVMLLGTWPKDIPYAVLNTYLPLPSKFSYGRRKINLPKVLDENLAFLIGVYDADGSKIQDEYSENGKGLRIAVAKDRPIDLKKCTEVIEKLFGIKPKIKQGDGEVYNLCVYSREINEFLKSNNLLKHSSIDVRIPDLIFNSPKQVIEAYLAGVFLGDGSNRGGKGGLRITTVSKEYAEEIQLLLLNLGIASQIKTQYRIQENWHTIYIITTNGHRFMEKFQKMLSLYCEKAEDNPISIRDGTFNWPFNLTERFAYLSGFQRTIARTNPTTSQKAVMFLEYHQLLLHEEDKLDAGFLTSTVSDTITSIEEIGVEEVYDIEVNNTHLLSGNGFYTSNSRRGALMLMLHDWHPDILEFIQAKQDLTRLVGANLSVCLSDAFMEAVESDGDWQLRFPDTKFPQYDEEWDGDILEWEKKGYPTKVYGVVKARDIWDKICEAAWASAEPGIHFLDRSNKWSNTYYFEKLIATNPCGEQPLGAWAVCNLGSINLSAFVTNGKMDYDKLSETASIATRMLDNVIDANFYFYSENEAQQRSIRRVGLGTMGLGDALIKMQVRYGSEESIAVIEKIYQTIRDAAYSTSADLAKEKGSFPKFNAEKFLEGYFIKQLPEDIRGKIAKFGVRNAVLLTQAPTGSTSLLAGVSSGIEPVFDFTMIRKDRLGEHIIYHPLYQEWKDAHPDAETPDYFASANTLTPDDHIKVQAMIQKYTDSSISKTVNAPNTHTIEDVKKLYMDSYKLGCKGITYYRDGSRDAVLSHIEKKPKEELIVPVLKDIMYHRPMVLRGRSYKIMTPVGEGFVTINRDDQGQPVEVFVTIGKGGMHTMADAEAIGRLASMALRLAGESRRAVAQKMASQLRGIGGSSQIGFGKDRVMSLADAVAKTLSEELALSEAEEPEPLSLNLTTGNGVEHQVLQMQLETTAPSNNLVGDLCPECGQATFTFEEGCKKCHSCGYSMC